MALEFELAGSQIDGARDYQEDAFLITHLTDGQGRPAALVIIADGMGGHAAGNVASNMAVQAFNKHVTTNYPSETPAEILHECVIKANNSIKETIRETPALSGMGCTLVAAILEDGKIWWASVGDSHLYLIRNKERKKVNADHSYGGFLDRMAAAGTPVEPEPGLARNMLMSAITGDEINEIDVSSEPLDLQKGDRVMLCSDGMDTLSEGKFIQFSDWSETPKAAVEALLDAIKEAAMPKQDNTTIVVVDVKERAVAAEAAPPPAAEAPPPVRQADIPAQPAAAGPSWQPPVEPAGKRGAGVFLWVIAVLVAVVAVGGYFVFTGQQGLQPPPVRVGEGEETGPGGDLEGDEAAGLAGGEETEAQPGEETGPSVSGVEAGALEGTGEEFQDRLRDGTPGPVMVVIPAGSFQMGSPGSSANTEERPRHDVEVGRYAMGKFEVTFAQYEKFAAATGRQIPDNLSLDKGTHPVVFVTWDDALSYARWLSQQTGESYSLPSESQWEYAAGAGTRSFFWWGYDEEPGRAHCFGCETGLDPRKPTRIGSFEANPFGLHDTAGNVAEWVYDCWHEDYNGAPATGAVWEGGDCTTRVVRGGSYNSPPQSIRHAKRDRFDANNRYDNIGFRVTREVD